MEIFTGRIAIVTGAASGIGRELALELARRGAKVILADIDAVMLDETLQSITDTGHEATTAICDVTDFAAVKALVEETAAEKGRLDYIFNNAGTCIMGETQNLSYDDWRGVIDLNLYGVVNGTAAAYPIMVRQGCGHIVNISSFAGLMPVAGQVPYVASKYGVVGLSNALRIEGSLHGVKVSVVCQGMVKTPLYLTTKTVEMDRDSIIDMLPAAMPPQKCARFILDGVEKNKAIILISPVTKLFWILQRLSPGLVRRIFELMFKRVLRIAKVDD
ncbi:MAG: SDR family NAD(P)-dependent oxidoreductase [Actinobacteria bacterium]|nr:SDR family NAD(P)-dependent oxidoreductase [Actinomycetota bacterium]